MDELMKGAETISLFCRINMNTKRELPIRPSEMGLLIFLVKEPGEHTPLQAAAFFKVTKPMVTTMIHSLERKEYISKVPSPTDKRSFVLKPSDKAYKLVNQTMDEYIKNMQLLKDGLGKQEFTRFIELLTKANNILLEERDNA
jgi:DNA-binding MarR family transcriptional regulator